jgi:hypothetical protein
MNEEKLTLTQKILMIQLEIKAMSRDKAGYNYKYFDINQIIAELKPLMKKHGLLVMQPLTHVDGKPALETIVASSDEKLSWTTMLPTNSVQTNKNGSVVTETDPQKMGSVITYFRRYALQSLFLLEAEDLDGVTK